MVGCSTVDSVPNLSVVDPSAAAQDNARQAGIEQVFDSAPGEALLADLIVLAIKPQITKAALQPLAGRLGTHSLVLSIVAGINAESLAALLGLSDTGVSFAACPIPRPRWRGNDRALRQ